MLADNFNDGIFKGTITYGIIEDTSINAVLDFVERNLPEFSTKNKGQVTMNEKGLTQRLCNQFNRNLNNEPFFFDKDHMERDEKGDSPSVDLGILSKEKMIEVLDRIYNEDESFFSIEAKRLGKTKTSREKEYVIGRFTGDKYLESGGIERFKKGIHGKKLSYAAMIGYLQVDDFDIWLNRINGWISDLIKEYPLFWVESDKLIKVDSKITHQKFSSINLRLTRDLEPDEVKLIHFWVSLVL